MQWIDLEELLRFMPRRSRFDMRQALLLNRFTPMGDGICHCVALGAAHEVMRAMVDVLAPDVSLWNCDLVWIFANADCKCGTSPCPFVALVASDHE